ncbi:FecCD family ABC transporter permease [Rubeoparvulum massiliense]|uniref:FecCD family ABC transporter permease n=1 Tax=Rubeoparvulum massiliense TaxID=1631346 RepID=UPI00065E4575|nr:iron ABC transporter permease [Rubeoparvulum massiliense]
MSKINRKRIRVTPYLIATLVVTLSFFLGISLGSVTIPLNEISKVISHHLLSGGPTPSEATYDSIVWDVRLPRVTLAFLVGSALSMAGAAFQGLLRNPLADPYTLGISSGSALGAVLVIYFAWQLPLLGAFTLPLIAIAAGFITMLLVLFFARLVQRNMAMETIILTGIIFSSFLGSLLSLTVALSGDELRQIITWLMGSVSMRGWTYVSLILPFFILGSILLMFNTQELNLLTFGEETAQQLGVHTQRRKLLIMIAASIMTGAAVAVAGTIGFVGLVIPHMVRLIWGADHRQLLPLSALFGGSFLILADLLARTIISPRTLPVGVITALIGAPVFAYILYRHRTKGGRQG